MTNQQVIDQSNVTPGQMLLNAENPQERKMLLIEREFEMQQRTANVFASSDVTPTQYRGKIANCIIAQDIANRLNVGTLEVMQNLFVVHGNPSFSAKYKIARINTSGKIRGQLKYNFVGTEGQDDWGCYCTGIDSVTGEELKGPTITIKLAKDEKWYGRSGSKWQTMAEKMLRYRSASWFGDTIMPEATFGMMSVDEAEDAGPLNERDITPPSNVSDLNASFKPKEVVNESEKIDTDSGEVTQVSAETTEEASSAETESQQETAPAEPEKIAESPAFSTLKKELLKTKNVEDATALKNAPAAKRMKKDETILFGEAVDKRVEAIQAGMVA